MTIQGTTGALPPGTTAAQLEAETRENLNELRQAINRFQMSRLSTNAAIAGTAGNKKGLPPWEVSSKVKELRDTEMTNRAVSDLRDLLTLMYNRAPSESELEAGPPGGEALGVWIIPASYVAMAALAGGAWSLSGLFNYLTERERRIQEQLGIQNTSAWDMVKDYAPKVALAGGAVFGGVMLYRWWRKRGETTAELTEEAEDDSGEEEQGAEMESSSRTSRRSDIPEHFAEATEEIPALPEHSEEALPEDELAHMKRELSEGAR